MGDLLTTGSVLAAFFAGGVALFAPCCIVFLAPSYLAVAVKNRRWRLLPLTFVFAAGLALVLVPITLGMSLVDRSLFLGSMSLVGGVIGVWLGGVLGDRLGKATPAAYLLVPAVAFLLALPCFVLAVQAKALWLVFILFLIPTGLNLVWLGPVITAVQHLVAPAQRSTASACFLFVNNLIGLGLGTWYFGAVSDALAPRFGAESLRYAIYSGLTFYVVSATLFVFAARGLKRDWVE